MITMPEELLGLVDYNDAGELILKDNANESQKKAFEQFIQNLKKGDMDITFEE